METDELHISDGPVFFRLLKISGHYFQLAKILILV